MPMPQRRTPFSVQALGRAVPPEPPLSAVAPMPLPRPEPMAAPATVVQPFGGLGAPPLAAVESELGSARHAAESTLGELGSTGQAAGARGAQALDGAAQAVHYAVGGGAGGAGLPSSDKDVEELAGRLYDRIRSRLRSDLLIGRERAGRITDLR
ncbi:MAG TPA: hypothetical protein VIA06_16525 [Candidatus Dormibacteraeota bacterium]|jgi:hypothetical protein|nr:hypothetical protein [Candidatus Dormibacteraeota bacterium]